MYSNLNIFLIDNQNKPVIDTLSVKTVRDFSAVVV